MVLETALSDPEMIRLKVGSGEVDPFMWLADRIDVRFPNPEILEISMTGGEPEVLKTAVNAVADAYMKEVVNVDLNERQKHYDDLRKLYEGYQEWLKQSRNLTRKLRGAMVPMVDYNRELLGQLKENLADCQRKQFEIRLQKASLEARLAARKIETARKGADAAPLDEELVGLEAQDKVILAEMTRLKEEVRAAAIGANGLDLSSQQAEITVKEDIARRIGEEVGKLDIELQAPPRVRLIEKAVTPKHRGNTPGLTLR
jgi:hypothetical protein